MVGEGGLQNIEEFVNTALPISHAFQWYYTMGKSEEHVSNQSRQCLFQKNNHRSDCYHY